MSVTDWHSANGSQSRESAYARFELVKARLLRGDGRPVPTRRLGVRAKTLSRWARHGIVAMAGLVDGRGHQTWVLTDKGRTL